MSAPAQKPREPVRFVDSSADLEALEDAANVLENWGYKPTAAHVRGCMDSIKRRIASGVNTNGEG